MSLPIACNACRLRSLLRVHQVARSRLRLSHLLLPSTRAGFATFPTRAATTRRQRRRNAAAARATTEDAKAESRGREELEENDELDDSPHIAPGHSPHIALDHSAQVALVEALYVRGAISRVEWRASVAREAGLEGDAEARVERLREWFGKGEVPREILEGEEKTVYARAVGREGREVRREGQEQEQEKIEEEREYEEEEEQEDEEEVNEEEELRSHPLTIANRFGTFPSTLEMPRAAFVEPVAAMLSTVSNKHLTQKALEIFGGPGLPYSTSTPHRGKLLQKKPIALDAYQQQMSPIEGDLYMGVLVPGAYSSILSVLVETRKRMGTAWAEELVLKAERGDLRVLDAGGGGAGALAARELLRAEWERMHERRQHDEASSLALAEADGRVGGEGLAAPTGHATVLAASDILRQRASSLLSDTTFIPRLPDYVHTETARNRGKFDLVLAPHTLWRIPEEHARRTHAHNLWSLLRADGGVLVLLEKGMARGFELVASARETLLDTRIASPEEHASFEDKEPGMIIAPCTNHSSCPMYVPRGSVTGRRNICSFPQRYHRPPFLQNILGANKARNHEDVEFSYLSLLRGRDLRSSSPLSSSSSPSPSLPLEQGSLATDRAFSPSLSPSLPPPHSLSLPRSVLPPLKRKGHVLLDLCTPAGQLERWIVPRAFGRQAYRDARKASHGDLWALGAKTRLLKEPVVKDKRALALQSDVEEGRGGGKRKGQLRSGTKISGLRDKRDKMKFGPEGKRKWETLRRQKEEEEEEQ